MTSLGEIISAKARARGTILKSDQTAIKATTEEIARLPPEVVSIVLDYIACCSVKHHYEQCQESMRDVGLPTVLQLLVLEYVSFAPSCTGSSDNPFFSGPGFSLNPPDLRRCAKCALKYCCSRCTFELCDQCELVLCPDCKTFAAEFEIGVCGRCSNTEDSVCKDCRSTCTGRSF